jgi:hypothetical protein
MDTYLEEDEEPFEPRPLEDIPVFPFPIEPIDIALARLQVASRIGMVPFDEYEKCSRSLWVVFFGDWGVWTRAVIPVDSQLEPGDPAVIAARCDEVADLLRDPECYGLAIAAVVLRRPAPARPGRGDRQVLRRLIKAAATRDTVPWTFFTAGPDGALPVLTKEQRERYGC